MQRRFSQLTLLLLALALPATPTLAGTTERVSVSSAGAQADGESYGPSSLSADGRCVAFYSSASNLVPGDTNGQPDAFVRDRKTGVTERVSISSSGEQGDGDRTNGAISLSADGRYVAFVSDSTNLAPGARGGETNVFVRDRTAGTTERISLPCVGTILNGDCESPSLSADGRYVAFRSLASNLVPGDTNSSWDVFVRDRQAGTTERVSISSAGVQALGSSQCPTLSPDGRYVAFNSDAPNLVPGDTNSCHDVFVRDRVAGTTERVSLSSTGVQGNDHSYRPSLSADGRYVAFHSYASNLVLGDTNRRTDVFIRDRSSGTTERVSVSLTGGQANGGSSNPSLSADGRYVAFYSDALNLVPGDANGYQDYFVRDLLAGVNELASISTDGTQGNGTNSGSPSLSADGRYVAFCSYASNLVPGDTNATADIFIRDRYDTLTTPAPFVQPGWNLVSIPADPADADPLSVFSGIDLPNASFQFWKNGADAGGYQIFGTTFGWTGPVARGTAYWFLSEGDPKPLQYAGLAPTTDFELTIPPHTGAPFWIMFGTPFPAAVNADSIQFKNDIKRPGEGYISWVSAYSDADSSKRIVDANALGWDATARRFVIVQPSSYSSEKAQFDPWWGYWMLVYDTNELKIEFPKP